MDPKPRIRMRMLTHNTHTCTGLCYALGTIPPSACEPLAESLRVTWEIINSSSAEGVCCEEKKRERKEKHVRRRKEKKKKRKKEEKENSGSEKSVSLISSLP